MATNKKNLGARASNEQKLEMLTMLECRTAVARKQYVLIDFYKYIC